MSPILVVCFMLCCGYIASTEAGKGKGSRQGHIIIQNQLTEHEKHLVPIYMPIPIPVPMPIGPGHNQQQGRHHHHHHQQGPSQHQQQEDEGEVKKIYLLQPIARPNGPPKQAAGFHQGQTHIHVNPPSPPQPQPAPIVAPPRFQMQSPQYEMAGYGGQEEFQQQQQQQQLQTGGVKQLTAHNMHSNDMKILPIVVIPPIAPMQPIQLQPNSHQRVSVGSQINNYVSTMEPPFLSKTHRTIDQFHDPKSFSEYGGSGGGAVFRETLGPRRLRSRGPRVHMQAYRRAGSRFRPRYTEEMPDDYDYPGPPVMMRHHRVFNHVNHPMHHRNMMPPRMHHARRKQFHPADHGPTLRMAARSGGVHDSIRDIIDQQVHFDDADENRNQPAGSMDSLTADNTDPKDSIALLDDTMDSVIGLKKPGKQSANQLSHPKYPSSELTQPVATAAAKQASDLTYYEHDIPQSNSEFDSHKEVASSLHSSNRIYSDERDALEEDEWWFDTMKSVSHAAPANETVAAGSGSNSTSTTTPTPLKS